MKKIKKILAAFLVLSLFFSNPNKVSAGSDCSVLVWQERSGNQCYAGGSGCLKGPIKTSATDPDGPKVFFKIENLIVQDKKYTGDITINLLGNYELLHRVGGIKDLSKVTTTDDFVFTGDMGFEVLTEGDGEIGGTIINLNEHKRSPLNDGEIRALLGESEGFSFNLNAGKGTQSYALSVKTTTGKNHDIKDCDTTITVSSSCSGTGSCLEAPVDAAMGDDYIPFEICDQISDDDQKGECISCIDGTKLGSDDDGKAISGIWTAIGCISTNSPESMVKTFIKIGLSIGGGITLLLILAGAFQLSISQGDPKKTDDAKQQITAAITGLVFIILSVTILQFIGVSLFQIPGFGI